MDMRRITKSVLALLLFCVGSTAQAGVVYNWSMISASPTIDSSSGQIEVTDSAWLSGTLDANYSNFGGPGGAPVPGSQLLNLLFKVNGLVMQIVPLDPPSASGDSRDFSIDLGLRFNNRDPLAGSIDALTTDDQVSFGGDPLWTIALFGSDEILDEGSRCFEAPTCSGATGVWSIDETTVPGGVGPEVAVAEPPAFLLFAGGLLLIGVASQRRSRWIDYRIARF